MQALTYAQYKEASTTTPVRFCRNPAQRMQIKRLARRWLALLTVAKTKQRPSLEAIEMDLAAIVGSGITFSLNTLERFGDRDFAHDMIGIGQHLDRTTGRLDTNRFLPRCSRGNYIAAMRKED